MQYLRLEDLSARNKGLLQAAENVMKHSYNPYSKFYVGAALRTIDGQVIAGTNYENAAYGSTICAERAALLRANSMGYRAYDSIAIIGKGETFKAEEPIAPCGSCRQMLFEASQIAGINLEVIMSNTDKSKIIISNINELLPLGFGPKDLGVDIKRYIK